MFCRTRPTIYRLSGLLKAWKFNHCIRNYSPRRFAPPAINSSLSSESSLTDTHADLQEITDKGLLVKSSIETLSNEDLYTVLKKASVEDVLDIVTHSLSKLDLLHVAICVKRLFKHVMRENDEDSRQRLINNLQANNTFQTLIEKVCQQSPHYDGVITQEIITQLYVLNYSSSSVPMQIFLHLAKFHLSDLTLDRLLYLGECLACLETTKQTSALQQGIKTLLPFRKDELESLARIQKISLLYHFGNFMEKDFFIKILFSIHKEIHELYLKDSLRLVSVFGVLDQEKVSSSKLSAELITASVKTIHAGKTRLFDEALAELCEDLIALKVDPAVKTLIDDILMSSGDQLAGNSETVATDKLRVMRVLWSRALYHGTLLRDLWQTCFLDVTALPPRDFLILLRFLCDAPDIDVQIVPLQHLASIMGHIMASYLQHTDETEQREGLQTMKMACTRCAVHTPPWLQKKLPTPGGVSRTENRKYLEFHPVEKLVQTVAGKAGYEMEPGSSLTEQTKQHFQADYMLRPSGKNTDLHKPVAVYVIQHDEWFRNMKQLKYSTSNILQETMQHSGCHVLSIVLNLFMAFEDRQKYDWLLHRLKNIEDFQSLECVFMNV